MDAASKLVAGIDWSGYTEFQQQVLRKVCEIPKGEVWTYKLIAVKIGHPKAARAVGNALKKCRHKQIPCHRVVGYNNLGGYTAPGGIQTKKKLLRADGYLKK